MGTIFIAGSYGVGKSTLCDSLSKKLDIPAFSSGDLITNVMEKSMGLINLLKTKVQIKIFLK